jgi:hypothetical protein
LNPDFWHYSFDLVHSRFPPRPLEDSQANSFPLFIAEIFAEAESSPNSQQTARVIELSCPLGDLRSLSKPETRNRPSNSWLFGDYFAPGQRISEFFFEIRKMMLSLGSSLHAFMNSLEPCHV